MRKHKIHSVKNKKLRIIGAIVCILVLISFITGVVIGIIGGYKYDVCLMKTGIWMSIISGILMGILHILYFRTSEEFRERLFGK